MLQDIKYINKWQSVSKCEKNITKECLVHYTPSTTEECNFTKCCLPPFSLHKKDKIILEFGIAIHDGKGIYAFYLLCKIKIKREAEVSSPVFNISSTSLFQRYFLPIPHKFLLLFHTYKDSYSGKETVIIY